MSVRDQELGEGPRSFQRFVDRCAEDASGTPLGTVPAARRLVLDPLLQ